MKKTLLFIFFLISGIVLGSLLGLLGENVKAFSFLSFGQSFGVDSFPLDLSIIKLTLGFTIHINVAQIICITGAILAYIGLSKRVK